MIKAYILTYNADFADAKNVIVMLKEIDSIIDLRLCLSNMIIFKSSENATTISKKIIEKNPNKRFFITEIAKNRQGWLPKELWSFIQSQD